MPADTPQPAAATLEPGLYRHFKGGLYEVLFTARHSETEEWFVVYRPVGSESTWVRPLAMFVEMVEVGGATRARFEKAADDVAGAVKRPS